MFIPFHTSDWGTVAETIHKGELGEAKWKTLDFKKFRVRIVEYSAGYLADHWCTKGHIIYCIAGEMETILSDGTKHILKEGMSYQVSDHISSHLSYSKNGVRLFIVDGDFLS